MNCPDFESQIALYVGGDLPEKELIKVEKHLTSCVSCSQFMVELQESQLSLVKFGQIDVTEEVFKDLRCSVLAQIAVKNEKISWWQQVFNFRYGFWRYAFVPSIALILLAASGYFLVKINNPKQPTDSAGIKSSVETPELPKTNVEKRIKDIEEPKQILVSHKKVNRSVKKLYKAKTNNQVEPANNDLKTLEANNKAGNLDSLLPTITATSATATNAATTKATTTQVKMEIQTSNPNIRIIWLVNKEEKTPEKRTLS